MTNPLNWFAQVAAVTKLSLQTVFERKGSSASAAFGIAGVVAVMVGVLSIGQGFRKTMAVSGSPDNVIVLRSGSNNEMMSDLTVDEVRVVTEAAAVARSGGVALASPELFVIINLPKRSTGTDANVPLRGVTRPAYSVRDAFKMTEGRVFEPGRNEVIVGAGAAREFAGLQLGSKIVVGRNEWAVVGIFSCGGGISESEIWTDAPILQGAYQRGPSYQAVHAKLTSAAAFQKFKDTLTADPRLNVKVTREAEYYAEQSQTMQTLILWFGIPVAVLMGLGATFGALNTMYTAVSARTREIATLRALGFRSSPVVISVLAESLFLALGGGMIGAALAFFAFDGYKAATMNFQTFSQVAFAFAVTPTLLVTGIVSALAIGFVGGLFPAVRAARLPVATALREV